jgi:hypothetical protein
VAPLLVGEVNLQLQPAVELLLQLIFSRFGMMEIIPKFMIRHDINHIIELI